MLANNIGRKMLAEKHWQKNEHQNDYSGRSFYNYSHISVPLLRG